MSWLRRKTTPSNALRERWDLDTPLLDLGGMPWTLRDAYQSTMVMGATGGGKSSASIAAACRGLARSGAGGACFTVKREDGRTYHDIFAETGREKDITVYSPTNPLRFNFIGTELEHDREAGSLIENVTALIMTVAELADRSRPTQRGGSENAEYFRQSALRLSRNGLLILVLSGREVTIGGLHRLVVSSPRTRSEAMDPLWQQGSFFFDCLRAAAQAPKNDSLHADFELALVFFMEEWADLNSRTRSSVESTLTSATDALSRGMVRDTLSATHCNFSPSMLESGTIAIFDYPILVMRDVGQIIQVVVKACIQRWLSRRKIQANSPPVFLIADECQHLIVAEDERCATTCRSARAAMVWATQSVSTLLEAFGGAGAEARLHSFLGNCGTQIHHQQTDIKTIGYVQELVGRSRHFLMNSGSSRRDDWLAPMFGACDGSISGGFSEGYEFELHAADMNGLVKGGPPHFFAEAIVYRGGQCFPSGRTWARVAIPQRRSQAVPKSSESSRGQGKAGR